MTRVSVKPRSVVLDLFGEYLRFADGEAQLGQLTTLLGAFDVAPATVRVTMSRLRREGWFTVVREGRESRYRLSESMLAVLDEGRERIFAAPPTDWDGRWTMVIYQMSESERPERERLRKSLSWHGFGPVGPSTWLAPGDRRETARTLVTDLEVRQAEVLLCLSDGVEQDRSLAGRCWDLDALAGEYDEFIASHRELRRDASRLEGAEALVARTALIARYRNFPFRDPRLPPELTFDRWPGREAYALFREVHELLGPAARAYVAEVIGREVVDAESVVD